MPNLRAQPWCICRINHSQHARDPQRRKSGKLLATGGRSSTLATSILIATLGAILLHHSLSGVDAGGADSAGPGADSLAMDGAGDAVMELDVELGEFILVDDAGLVKIAQRALVDDVTHGEAFDRLVLRRLAPTSVAHN